MITAANGLQQMLNALLDFSKIEAGKLTLLEVTFSPHDLVREVVELMEGSVTERGLKLTVTIDPEIPPYLDGDNLRLKQVLVNLVGNAIKFTETGEVGLTVRSTVSVGDKVFLEFTVHDSGIGMTPEQLESIFEPFIQGDGSTTRIYGGTGLGLSICQRLIHLMGGAISVISKPGEGSSFTFTIQVRNGNPGNLTDRTFPERLDVVDEMLKIAAMAGIPAGNGDEDRATETHPVPSHRPLDKEALAGLLYHLHGLLKKNSVQAKALMPSLHELLQGTVLEAASRQIEMSLEKFDFRHARSMVENLAESMTDDVVTRGT